MLHSSGVISHNITINRNNDNNHVNSGSSKSASDVKWKIDPLDEKIMSLMMNGTTNKEMAKRLKVPLSTIQRRTRRLFQIGFVNYRTEINVIMMGFKKGLVHIYIRDGNTDQVARKVSTLESIESVGIHIGNSDITGNVIYRDSKELLQTISDIKKLDGVDRVVWSEEVYRVQYNNNKESNLINRRG
jgi:DNA-binding Lrp family transcriptional regulator